ncbi:MAG: GNAT family N-acetyltransferase [Halofilum sp. (in: g-proteobacteria)]|nr:GNAT family N-acetyltransferase [Halofilum sp. (in: g-proteobacteria)]
MQLRDVTRGDLPALHALNQASVPAVGSVPPEQFEYFLRVADYFRLAEIDGGPAGFLIGLRPGSDYGSLNYAWFSRRYADFVYIDRLAVDARWRRQGVASALYADIERYALGLDAPLLACEVNLRPRNDGSLAFHERNGFTEVGRQDTEGGSKTVSLLIRSLGTGAD